MTTPDSYFVRTGDSTFLPTRLTSGAWNEAEQHISPMNGLIMHELDRWVAARGEDDRVLTRLSVDILGVLDLGPCDVRVDVLRPGRAVELVEVAVANAGRLAVRARAWRVATGDTTAVAGGAAAALAHPDSCAPWLMSDRWPGDYIASLDVRPVGDVVPGRTTAWIATDAALVAGEPATATARFIGLVDTANGIAVRQSPEAWLYPNIDLTLHLFRQPEGRWVGLDTTCIWGPSGAGLTSTVLHDVRGQVGRAEQSLVVRPR